MQNCRVEDDSFDAKRKAGVKKKDSLFQEIQFHDYDKEADQRYESTKAFRIPKKTSSATPTSSNENKVSVAVRSILREMEEGTSTVAKVSSADQENLLMEEEEMPMEVTEVEIVLME